MNVREHALIVGDSIRIQTESGDGWAVLTSCEDDGTFVARTLGGSEVAVNESQILEVEEAQ